VSIAKTAWNNLTNNIRNGIDTAVNFVMNGVNNIRNWFMGLVKDAPGWASDMINGFINNIRNLVGNVGKVASEVANKIRAVLHFSKPDTGPLADADQWMPDFGDMLSSGMNAQVGKVQAAAINLSKPIAMSLGVTGNAGVTNAIGNVNLKGGLVPSSSTPLQGGSTTTNNSGGTTNQTINITINVPQGRIDKAGARQIAEVVRDELSSMQRRSGNMFTGTSGGR
jgi:hypothetical protein